MPSPKVHEATELGCLVSKIFLIFRARGRLSFCSMVSLPRNERLLADETRFRQISERIPAGRWGDPKDFAGPVVFLASSASQYVCGELLVVDGVSYSIIPFCAANNRDHDKSSGMDGSMIPSYCTKSVSFTQGMTYSLSRSDENLINTILVMAFLTYIFLSLRVRCWSGIQIFQMKR